ncbi:MAG TPA: Na+/H+ antiporter subunit E [Candidatus Dormibacteraeota bacterium]|jgi:multisubunit Na+/H+ antiporter MnhE subunit|nr:Na+/H+ antiporter subunit E [Candidatus Dormibacteraeota bacterium]
MSWDRASLARYTAVWLVNLALLFGLWELFVDSFIWPEIAAGLGAAAIVATATTVTLATLPDRFGIDAGLLLPAWRLPWRLLTDTYRVFIFLLARSIRGQPIEGRVLAVPFDAGGDDPRSALRRALQDYYVTFTSNTLSFGIDREEGCLLVHELVASGSDPESSLAVRL